MGHHLLELCPPTILDDIACSDSEAFVEAQGGEWLERKGESKAGNFHVLHGHFEVYLGVFLNLVRAIPALVPIKTQNGKRLMTLERQKSRLDVNKQ